MIEELRKVCVVQERKKWYPAACTGAEFFAVLNFNLTITTFFNNVLIPSAELWLFTTACKAICKAFSKFLKKNSGLEFQTLTLTFNDATIVVNETLANHYDFLVQLYQVLPKHWVKFQELGIKEIINIESPILPNDSNVDLIERYCTGNEITPESCLWLIHYELGLEHCFYNPAIMNFIVE